MSDEQRSLLFGRSGAGGRVQLTGIALGGGGGRGCETRGGRQPGLCRPGEDRATPHSYADSPEKAEEGGGGREEGGKEKTNQSRLKQGAFLQRVELYRKLKYGMIILIGPTIPETSCSHISQNSVSQKPL